MVEHRKCKYVINERLGFPCLWWYTENLGMAFGEIPGSIETNAHMREDLLGQLSPLAFVKCLVETKYTSAPLQTVACHLELVHRMDVLHVHLDTRAVWCLRGPKV